MTDFEGVPQGPDLRTIAAAHRRAEDSGLVSPNCLPAGRLSVGQAFAETNMTADEIAIAEINALAAIPVPKPIRVLNSWKRR